MQKSKPTHVEIPLDIVNAVLEYLSHQPFVQVFDLITNLKREADASFTAQQQQQNEGSGA